MSHLEEAFAFFNVSEGLLEVDEGQGFHEVDEGQPSITFENANLLMAKCQMVTNGDFALA